MSCKYHPGASRMTVNGTLYSKLRWEDCQIIFSPENDTHFCQWTIASVPGHPIMLNVLHLIFQRVMEGLSKSEHFVHFHTGPGVWTTAITNFFLHELGHKKPFVDITANEFMHRVWEDPEYNRVAGKYGICIMASSFFGASSEPENVQNIYGSQKWASDSWIKKAEEYREGISEA